VGATVFDCAATHAGLGVAGTDVSMTDFRLYVHDVKLRRIDGTFAEVVLDQDGLWQHENLALLDFEDKTGACANGTVETNFKIKGRAPVGGYDGVSFSVGVPFASNHGDVAVAPSPLNLSAMFWSWNGGYKFVRVDAVPVGGGGAFNVHLGSTGCQEDGSGKVTSCARENRPRVELAGFDPLTGKVIVDYAALVAGSDLSQDAGGGPGCMSGVDDPECVSVFSRLGIHVDDGSIHPEEQTFFRAE
jgi:uncharacterized repeat protein (TIGR04052 family)